MPVRDPLDQVRQICLLLPEAYEKEAWGGPTFRVNRGKMFVMYVDNHHNDGIIGIWCNAPLGAQAMLIDLDPKRFFKPPYMGPSGWIGMRLDTPRVDWKEVRSIIEDGYRMALPNKKPAAKAATVRMRSARSAAKGAAIPRR